LGKLRRLLRGCLRRLGQLRRRVVGVGFGAFLCLAESRVGTRSRGAGVVARRALRGGRTWPAPRARETRRAC
jgi:hypothetical protein